MTGDQAKLFGRLLELLSDGGVLVRGAEGAWEVAVGSGEASPAGPEPPPDTSGSVEQELLRRCGRSLAEVLRGRADPLALLFEGEPGAADLYWESPGARAVNRLVGETVGLAVRDLPGGRRLRVLEVGAGTGATTGSVLSVLPAGTEYDYTDVSAGFFAAAEERFGGSGVELRYRALDIERDPGDQGFGAHGVDVVVAANVLHATRDLGESLSHCRKLLAPSGLLVLVEGDGGAGLARSDVRAASGVGGVSRTATARTTRWRGRRCGAGRSRTRDSGRRRSWSWGRGRRWCLSRGPVEVEGERGLFVVSGGETLAAGLAEELARRGQGGGAGSVGRGPGGVAFALRLAAGGRFRCGGWWMCRGSGRDGSGATPEELEAELRSGGFGGVVADAGASATRG